jgi:Fe-S oxidoreductase
MSNHKTLSDLKMFTGKCPRCSLCKFPPLTVVESRRFSMICPSYHEYKFHSHSGGGRIVMGMSVDEKRSAITDEVRDIIFQCTLCGGCDMACKYSSDIEILQALYALRAESHRSKGPLPAHAAILERLDKTGYPLPVGGSRVDWMKEAGVAPGPGRDFLLYVGCRYALLPENRRALTGLVTLLKKAGYSFGLLGDDEPCCGRTALDLGDQDRFDRMAARLAEAIHKSGAHTVVCADAECYSTLLAHYPKAVDLNVRIFHPAQILAEAVKQKRLKFSRPFSGAVAYHDPCNLGRLAEPYQKWDGAIEKVMGQLVVYNPPRTVNRGTNGCYEPPRRLLDAVPGMRRVEFQRRKEYAFCCGGGGAANAAFPEFSANTADDRLAEAKEVGAGTVVTACPNCVANLSRGAAGTGIEVMDMYEFLSNLM